ncbi:MAG TPA: CatB-related O-acetyltransferase [Mucilaginibacter sp.]|jgi:acetyltransferase-like isoleucine patch superfamily enzyme|nr:CatB-related O-acetyltransferase [Mucilaginibacter sp.]
MFKEYIDYGFLTNPVSEYLKWLIKKTVYQLKYWGKHLRIGYKSKVSNSKFGKYNWIVNDVVIENSILGDFTYISSGSVILEAEIGRFCSIGPNVRIAPGKHPTSIIVSTHPAIYSNPSYCLMNFSKTDKHDPYRKVIVGNDVWICANVVISDGLTIGDGAVIAANSVVTRNVEPYSIVGGVPAKHIKYRFERDQINFLLNNKWWEKDLNWLEKNAFMLWDIDEYIRSN